MVAIDKLIDRNAKSALNQDEYARHFNAPTARPAKLTDQHERLTSHIINKQNRLKAYEYYKTEVAKLDWAHLEFRECPTACVRGLGLQVVRESVGVSHG